MYTHFYHLWKRVPRARRKELAKFIHRFKCLCGHKYHLHVTERLDGDIDLGNDGTTHAFDNVSIEFGKGACGDIDTLLNDINALIDEFGIPRKNLIHKIDWCGEYIMIYLYTDYK